MTDDQSESGTLLTAKKECSSSNDGQTEMGHNSPVDCLLHRSGQTSTEPGRNDIGAKAAISFLVNRLTRMEELSSFYILRVEEYRLLHSGEER
jgi:hypothetical protein